MKNKNHTHMYLYCITVYVEDYWEKIKITEAQRIALSENVFYPGGWRCQTMLEAPHNLVIWLNFHYFDIWRPSVIYCTDVLRIYDGKITFSHAMHNSAKKIKIKNAAFEIAFFLQSRQKITWKYIMTFKPGTRFYYPYFRGQYTVPWTFSQQGFVSEVYPSVTSYHQLSGNLQIQKHGCHHQYWI